MEAIKLKAEIRPDKSTKKSLSDLRGSWKIPAVIYGGKGKAVHVIVDEKLLMGSLRSAGANAIMSLEYDKVSDTVILKSLQKHPVTGRPIHADFQRILMTEKIEVKVPLHAVGEAPGVKLQGGLLEHNLRELTIRCLPNAIPQRIDVDVSKLEMTMGVSVKDLVLPEGIEVLDSPEQRVIHVVAVKEEVVAVAAAPAEGAAAQPEVIAKGKEKEEGAEGKAAEAKPGEAKKAGGEAKKPEGKKEGGK